MKTTKMARMVVTALFAAVVSFFLFAGQSWAQPTHHHRHGPRYGQKSESSSTAKKPTTKHHSEKPAPLSDEEQLNEIEKGKEVHYDDPPDPKPDLWDKLGSRYRDAKTAVEQTAKSVGSARALVVFHVLMFFIPLLIIILIPRFAAKKFEMTIEATLIIIAGCALLASNWIAELKLSMWVWFCLIIPGGILFLVSWWAKEGPWKLLLLFLPPIVMTGLAMLGILDSAMSELIHGSILAIMGITLPPIYLIFRKIYNNRKTKTD